MKLNLTVLALFLFIFVSDGLPNTNSNVSSARHSTVGDKVVTEGGDLTITTIDQKRGYGSGEHYDGDIRSPKSASFSPDGKKLYVNSLEGCKTVVYDMATRKKIKVIDHSFESGEGPLWLAPSGFYEFTHYPDGAKKPFLGKPVEEAITKNGKYMFVPYYRRSFDINAQDPSALAIIDAEKDEIIMMTETGPLPKMVALSNNQKLLAITHWGDNTVGFLDISDSNPKNWKHLSPVTISKKLNLNYSLTKSVDRDSGSGLALRGTVFLPGDSLLLVSGMGGALAVIDVNKREWIGMVPQLSQVRHITMKGGNLFFSRNSSGEVLTLPVDSMVSAIQKQRSIGRDFRVNGLRSVKVGGGARTLKVSPEGKFIFVACNTSSALYIVRTEDMKVLGHIAADSFPVGLDISPDGKTIVTTSQGRKGKGGGNAVNFFNVDYKVEEKPEIYNEQDNIEENSIIENPIDSDSEKNDTVSKDGNLYLILGLCILGILIIAGVVYYVIKKKNDNKTM